MTQERVIDLTGNVFGRLTALEYLPKRGWRCLCECGKEVVRRSGGLRAGTIKSCGCLKRDIATGLPNHPLYSRWSSMISRCENARAAGYENYGGRGIRVCERWRSSFANFLTDMGLCPEGMSLDRFPDVNGNYEPGNCRWATKDEQSNNKRSNRVVEYKGEPLTMAQLARRVGISPALLRSRLNLGWDVEKATTVPPRPMYRVDKRGSSDASRDSQN
jgi:hypothetical protein